MSRPQGSDGRWLPDPRPAHVRVLSRIAPAGECWVYQGGKDWNGYGAIWKDGRQHKAHRVVYEAMVGPIPDGLQLDHLCRNTSCVNPSHLEPVTSRENTLRGTSWQARNARKEVCIRGHSDFRPRKSGGRWCRPCARIRQDAWKARKAAAA